MEDKITGYTITWYKSNEKNPTKYTINKDARSRETFIATNLDELTYYTIELTANNAAGKGKKWVMDGMVVSSPDSKFILCVSVVFLSCFLSVFLSVCLAKNIPNSFI